MIPRRSLLLLLVAALAAPASGVGRRIDDHAIEFEFRYPEGPFLNTFTWDEKSATWTSRMESSDANGRRSLLAEDVYRRS